MERERVPDLPDWFIQNGKLIISTLFCKFYLFETLLVNRQYEICRWKTKLHWTTIFYHISNRYTGRIFCHIPNRYAGSESPWRTPLLTRKYSEYWPLTYKMICYCKRPLSSQSRRLAPPNLISKSVCLCVCLSVPEF